MTSFTLGERQWCGWQETPAKHAGWGSSPIYITGLKPLKTGKGILRITFIQPLHPGGGIRRKVELRVLHRAATHLVGTLIDDGGEARTAIVSRADFGWLRSHCPLLWLRRPYPDPYLFVDGIPPAEMPAYDYLTSTFGADDAHILIGANSESFGCEKLPMPSQTSSIIINKTAASFESVLIVRGFVPKVMEHKWFIYFERGRLLFRRSWTGILIYDLEATWRGDRIYFGHAVVNRDLRQYPEIDDEYDARMLLFLIEAILAGHRSEFPMKAEAGSDHTVPHTSSTAGDAMR